jgi:hypothetical protein
MPDPREVDARRATAAAEQRGCAASSAATPATASHSSTWSPTMMPTSRGAGAESALAGGRQQANVPGRGSIRNSRIAAQNAP